MDYTQVEAQFKTLKEQFATGKLDEAAFKARLNELMVQDAQGRWWMIGYETGEWYTHDGTAWVRADPPGHKASRPQPPPVQEQKAQPAPAPARPVDEAKPYGAKPVSPPATPAFKSTPSPAPAKAVKKMGWGFWGGWLGSFAVGVGMIVWLASMWHSSEELTWAFAMGGVVIGFGQWLVMRQYIQGSWWWIPGNAIYSIITAITGNSSSSGNYGLVYFLLFAYPVINMIVMPVVISRKRRSA